MDEYRFDWARQQGAREIRAQREAWQKKMQEARQEFKSEMRLKYEKFIEGGPEYWKWVSSRKIENEIHEHQQQAFVSERNQIRMHQGIQVGLEEETELKVYEKADRVEWSKRKFYASTSNSALVGSPANGFTPASPNNFGGAGNNNRFDSAPNFENEFYDEIPPPPPPTFFDQNQGFNNGQTPPPPPAPF